jgi:serine/threonine protein phosphatase PrpC
MAMKFGNGSHFQWRSVSSSHVGTVRKVNEDSVLERPEIGLWVVADGMGGHAAGDVASSMIVESLQGIRAPSDEAAFLEDIERRLQRINTQLLHYAAEHVPGGVMGSTVAAFASYRTKALCLWAGDSRIYRLRGGELERLTRDHSQVEDLISLGIIRREDAEHHPESNIITRAVGATPDLAIDQRVGELRAQDTYLICSDGLTAVVKDAELGPLMEQSDCEEAVSALLHLALVRGARDNVTLVIIKIEDKAQGPGGGAG